MTFEGIDRNRRIVWTELALQRVAPAVKRVELGLAQCRIAFIAKGGKTSGGCGRDHFSLCIDFKSKDFALQ